jgi:hypothetical protein
MVTILGSGSGRFVRRALKLAESAPPGPARERQRQRRRSHCCRHHPRPSGGADKGDRSRDAGADALIVVAEPGQKQQLEYERMGEIDAE